MKEKDNPVFQLNWEYDLQHIQEPVAYLLSDQCPDINSINDYRKYPLVQADPTDKICFSKSFLGKCEYRSNKLIWMSTLDRYLRQYYLLARKKEEIEYDHIQTQRIQIPYCVHDEYLDYLTRRNKYPVCYDIRLFKRDEGAMLDDENVLLYNIPRFAGSSYLNYICHSIFTRKNADDDRYSLFSDGLKFKLHECEDFIPPFDLVDYFEHEMVTGISLSVEISAVLLEFEDIALMEKAWAVFCENALPRIIHSQLLFTRNTVARHFFQQILMEQKINDYRWYPEGDGFNMQAVLKRALLHTELIWNEQNVVHHKLNGKNQTISVLSGNIHPSGINVPEEQIDEALEHLWTLLSVVTQPFNLCYNRDNKAREVNESIHLVVFCNPKHKNVQNYLDDLTEWIAKRDQMKNLARGKKYPTPRKRDHAHTIFRMVHSTVRKMINNM